MRVRVHARASGREHRVGVRVGMRGHVCVLARVCAHAREFVRSSMLVCVRASMRACVREA